MEPKEYQVVKIEGEYAYLRDRSGKCPDDLFIAMSLLPMGTDLGSVLIYEMPDYYLKEE